MQKRYLKTEQQIAKQNSEQNGQLQIQSQQAKSESDNQLEDKKNQAKERQIVMQGIIDLAKVGIQMPNELKALAMNLIQNVEVPLVMENQQMQQGIEQAQMEAQQQSQEQQEPIQQ